MTERNPAAYLQAGSHDAETFRRVTEALLTTHGVRTSTDLAVTANGTPNMSVNVAAGEAFIIGTEQAEQGAYHVYNDATVNKTIAAADATNPRYDLIVAKVQDAEYSGATNAWSLAVVTGTPAASPADPTVPANSITLARVQVDAGVTSIVSGKITDLRTVRQIGLTSAADLAAWTAYTPVVTASTTNPTWNAGNRTGRYKVVGKTCTLQFFLTWTALGAGEGLGAGVYRVSLPVTAASATYLTGAGLYYRAASGLQYSATIFGVTTTTVKMLAGNVELGNGPSIGAPGNGDVYAFSLTYEVA